MHLLQSVVNGFSIILGSHLTQLAAMLTLLVAIRKPPKYVSEADSYEAKWLFTCLVFLHAGLAIVKFHSTYYNRRLWDKTSIFMLVEVVTLVWVCNFEIFPQYDTAPTNS